MLKPFKKIYPVYIAIDIILMALIFYLLYLLKYNRINQGVSEIKFPYLKEYTFIFVLWGLLILRSFKRKNLYSTDRSLTVPKEIFMTLLSIFYASVLAGSIIFFAQYNFFSRYVFLSTFILLIITLSGWRTIKRLILRKLISEGFHNINVLIIGTGRIAKIVVDEIQKNPLWGLKIIGFLDDKEAIKGLENNVIGKLKDFSSVIKRFFIDEVIITLDSERRQILGLIQQAKDFHLGIRVVPDNFDETLPVMYMDYLGLVPMLTYGEKRHHPAEFALKRIFDLFISLFLLILLFPVFLVIAILIKLDSDGPVFYMQKRVGFKGKTFDFYKFRSMVNNADILKPALLAKNEVRDGVIFKMKNDPRITKTGRILRKYSLDELPQLINVFRGDMSLVGPRPPVPDEVAKYSHTQMQRLSIRPGITGLSQIRGRSELTFSKWVKWDSWYINNWSFGLDLRILLSTIPAVFRGKGAY